VGKDDIDSHTTKVMENVKELVETGGGTMDSILQLTVYLASIDYYEAMNKIFKTYFPNGGPARTTVAVAALPGNSMVEINCIAAIVRQARKVDLRQEHKEIDHRLGMAWNRRSCLGTLGIIAGSMITTKKAICRRRRARSERFRPIGNPYGRVGSPTVITVKGR